MNSKLLPILLVEDNPMDADLTRRALVKRGLLNPFIVARDGEEALANISRWEAGEPCPLVVLLDVNLPKVGGLEVLRSLKAHPASKAIPVILMVSSNADRAVVDGYNLGASLSITKPLDFERFAWAAAQLNLDLSVNANSSI